MYLHFTVLSNAYYDISFHTSIHEIKKCILCLHSSGNAPQGAPSIGATGVATPGSQRFLSLPFSPPLACAFICVSPLSGFLYGGEGSLWEAGSHSVATNFCREKPHLGKREKMNKKTIKVTLKKKKKNY